MKKDFVIKNEEGIHARPATIIVKTANSYKSDINLTFNGVTVDMKSIMGVLSLGVTKGSLITVEVKGVDEIEAMRAIERQIFEFDLK